MPNFTEYQFSYTKVRFQNNHEDNTSCSSTEFHFSSTGEKMLVDAIETAIFSSQQSPSEESQVLPLQGLLDLTAGTIDIAALKPRPGGLAFQAYPLFEHKEPGLFETGQYSPRLCSYQKRYSDGPTAHQQLLFFAANKPVVSADDAENKRGFAINIHVKRNNIHITIDGKSLSINETAQYLRTMHPAGYTLSEEEAKNSILKKTGIYSALCEEWLFDKITTACQIILQTKVYDASIARSSSIASSLTTSSPVSSIFSVDSAAMFSSPINFSTLSISSMADDLDDSKDRKEDDNRFVFSQN